MKKLFLLSIAAIMVLSLAACGDSAASSEATTSIKVTTPTEATTSSKAVILVDITTHSGLSMKLPSGMTLQDANGSDLYVSSDKSDLVAIV